jgi:hypothetical protein
LGNTTREGKRYAKSPKLGPALPKYLEEIANPPGFLRRGEEWVETQERICDRRPVLQRNDCKERAELKKKLRKRFLKRSKTKSAGSEPGVPPRRGLRS